MAPFACPHCGHLTDVSDAFAGMVGPCAGCGREIAIPHVGPTEDNGQPLPRRRAGSRGWLLVVIAACVLSLPALCVFVAVPALVRAVQQRVQQEQCAERMRSIAVALEAYHTEYSVFPPAYLADAGGKPAHTWRVLLLPFLGEDEERLYKKYRFTEPWNGPHNRRLADQMPLAYSCPCDPAVIDSQTSYLALVDPATGQFAAQPPYVNNTRPGPKPKALSKYLLVEVSESGVNWLEPRDLELRSGAPQAGDIRSRALFSFHGDRSHVLVDDGTTQSLEPDKVRALLELKSRPAGKSY